MIVRPAAFLDRDDTIIDAGGLPPPPPPAAPGDVLDPARVRLLDGAKDAVHMLASSGLRVVVITNQGGVARGGGTIRDIERVNDRVRELLDLPDLPFYACPYHPLGGVPSLTMEHTWRKPSGGMLVAASDELSLDLAPSWMVGDAKRDVDAGINAGLDPVRCLRVGPDGAFMSLLDAASHIQRALSGHTARTTTLRLRAADPAVFAEPRVRETVESLARGIAERTGIVVRAVLLEPTAIVLTLETDTLAAIGFLAELRRTTNAWHEKRAGVPLWPLFPGDSDHV